MKEPVKNNEDILSDQHAFQAAYARAREYFGKFDGVVGVAFGQKKTGGEFKDEISIIVFVREKKKEEEIPPEQRIPPTFEGYRTDVRVVREARFQSCDNTATYETIQGGIQISPIGSVDSQANVFNYASGTLSCIVRKRNDSGRENVYLLSCKHVLYAKPSDAKEYVYHPFPPVPSGFSKLGNSTALGPIQKESFFGDQHVSMADPIHPGQTISDDYFVDCAIALINIDCKCCGSTCTKDTTKYAETIIDLQLPGDGAPEDANRIKDVRNVMADTDILQKKVYKVGRTTGRTAGKVVAVNAPLLALSDFNDKNSPQVTYHNTIEILFVPEPANTKNCKNHSWFSEEGDSGALILDEQGRAIGILSLGPNENDPDFTTSNACHIVPILDLLNICIPTTTGTSHGSSHATDGSGIAPATPVLGDFPVGEVVFTAQPLTGERALAAGLAEPVPVTEEEERHMRALLAELRATSKGRELHFVFGEVRREVGYLVRNVRQVKAAWLRNKGPAFLAHALNHLKGYSAEIPAEVDGVLAITLLTRMSEVLYRHGSNPLRRAIEAYGPELLQLAASGNIQSAQECIAYLKEQEKETV